MHKLFKVAVDAAKAGQLAAAEKAFDQLLVVQPDKPLYLHAAAEFHYRQSRKTPKAAEIVDKLLRKSPKNPDYQVLGAEIFLKLGNRRRAAQHAELAYGIAPKSVSVLLVNTAVQLAESRFDAALDFVTKALKIAPDNLGAKYQLARIQISYGKLPEALECLDDILTRHPDAIEALAIYVSIQDLTPGDPYLIGMRDRLLPEFTALKDPRLPQLLKLLGKAHHEIGDFDAEFTYFAKAKAIEPQGYDADGYARFVGTLCTNISRSDYFARGHDSDSPVFIVGMPRCGSTLLEQVLSGHPAIGSAGESLSLRRIMHDVGVRNYDGARLAKAIKQMPPEASRRLAARYLDETHQDGAARTVDKSLHNFELLGFMAAMLPKARIIHMRRDPMDHCLSCYLQSLPASHRYTQSLDAIGHSYLEYRRLMDHWAKVLPNPVISIKYEDLVADLEANARRIIAFLGLEWNDACLDFQSARNQVQTISVKQVRQPLYATSIQRWRRYDPYLAPLKSRLAPFYPDGFDAPSI